MSDSKVRVSLRSKIMLLVVVTLATSLGSYVFMGSSLITSDKRSYIYDYLLAKAEQTSDRLERLVDAAVRAASAGAASAKDETAVLDPLVGDGVLLLNGSEDGELVVEQQTGKGAAALTALWKSQGWNRNPLGNQTVKLGAATALGIPVLAVDPGHKKTFVFFAFKPQNAFRDQGAEAYTSVLFDANGKRIFPAAAAANDRFPNVESYVTRVSHDRFPSGVREWPDGAPTQLTAYKQVFGGGAILLVSTPLEMAFEAAQSLVLKSTALGLSILLLSIGATVLFSKGLSFRLNQMWLATQKVQQGDFAFRIDLNKAPADEVTGLARSFNRMSERIIELMKQTAQKARLDKEIETAQAVQRKYFPKDPLQDGQVHLVGKSIPASECGGDWWTYSRSKDKVLVAIGDVTGHGVHAALVTAAVHASFYEFSSTPWGQRDSEEIVEALATKLNSAVYAAGGNGEYTMTLFCSVLDLANSELTYANAAHPPAYLFRAEGGTSKPSPLTGARCESLGLNQKISVATTNVPLQKGDVFFWYTDGLFEHRADESRMNKKQVLEQVNGFSKSRDGNLANWSSDILNQVETFFGGAGKQPDDLTVVFGKINT